MLEAHPNADPSGRPTVLLVSSGYHLYREYLLRMISQAARVVLFLDREPSWERSYITDSKIVDTLDAEAMITAARAVAAMVPIDGVICWDEIRMVHAARVAEALGVPGTDPVAVARCRDKHQTRSALAAASVPQAISKLVSSVEEATATAFRIGYPVVVKPRALGASIGVSRVEGPDELAAAYHHARTSTEDGVPHDDASVLVEEYLEGPEISVDAAWVNGRPIPLFVARKILGFPPHFEEIGHVVNAADPLLLDPALLGVLDAAHRAVGFRTGITHTELRLTDAGPKVIEINARLGDDLIPYVGWVASGIDPGQVAVDVACGRPPRAMPIRLRVASVHFLYPAEDTVVGAVDMDKAALPASVNVAAALAAPGQRLELPPAGHVTSRYAYVVTAGKTTAECAAGAEVAARAIKLRPEESPKAAGGRQ
ncbi:ATP-grasp domain-containing protein [Polyangium jinanense]|uniref:ATP-grasp domain-containing protein n=1 Tax=Polyangium jinanense TaxID=2829994 RepID=A0A9X3XD05_9BACT|nr:ATP-grasp domain-containing protein [Polyangium jinanense]MDC3961414.1 ATP-grasp domain-containing protein [Polyangium jinanense]MDC3987015.1 ATP-grasp domain-containing protein [Polyangium jinanense]